MTRIVTGPPAEIPPSTFRYDDVGWDVTVQFDVAGDWLSFDPPVMQSCSADERIAKTAFFDQWPYPRHPSVGRAERKADGRESRCP